MLAAAALVLGVAGPARAATDAPGRSTHLVSDVPANVLLTMSVEFPTAMPGVQGRFQRLARYYLGYFGPRTRC